MPARLLVTPNAVAGVLFDLIRGVAPDEAQRNLAAAYFADTGAPVDHRSFQRFTDALILSLPQQRKLLELVPRWQSVFSGAAVTQAQAEEFIRQYLAALDHSLFVKLPVFVGRYTGQGRHAINFGGFGDTQVDSWLLVRTLAGEARFRAGLRDFALAPGQLVLIEPGTLTDFSGAGGADWCFYWVVFQCADSWRAYLQWPVTGPGVRQLAVDGDAAVDIDVALDQLYRNFIGSGPHKIELDHNLLEQLLLRCASCLPSGASRALDPRVVAARAFIDEHYAEDIGLSDIAAATNLSPSRLSGLFRQETGASVMAYRNERRLVKAAQLLLHSNLRVADIGQRVGYTEQAFFSRIFRKHLGISPRQYRGNRLKSATNP
jgi:AraC family transcriptional regulator, arabinose operon regulatory protein